MYQTIAKQVAEGKFAPCYLLWGKDRYFIERTVGLLRDALAPGGDSAFNFEKYEAGEITAGELAATANTMPFLAERKLILVNDVLWFGSGKKTAKVENSIAADAAGSSSNDKNTDKDEVGLASLLAYLENPCPSTVLVFVAAGNILKTRKLVKAVDKQGIVAEFAGMKGEAALHWVTDLVSRRGKQIEREAATQLLLCCDGDFSLLEQETEKLVLHAGKERLITLADVELLVANSTTTGIFALVDKVAEGRAEESLLLLKQVLLTEPEGKIIPLLAGQFHLICQCSDMKRQGYSYNDMMQATGKNYRFIVEKAVRQGARFSEKQLLRALQILLQADLKGKSGISGLLESIETAILQICVMAAR